mgnify:CR=1 FL=1
MFYDIKKELAFLDYKQLQKILYPEKNNTKTKSNKETFRNENTVQNKGKYGKAIAKSYIYGYK